MKISKRLIFVITVLLIIVGTVMIYLLKVRSQIPEVISEPAKIIIDYPYEGSIFPPEFPAPTWIWRDINDKVDFWEISFSFGDGYPAIVAETTGERLKVGEIDPRCVSPTNRPPALTPEQASAHCWTPTDSLWDIVKKHSVNGFATVNIFGRRRDDSKRVLSQGWVSISTSTDSVGAPIFYRDVPLMPSKNEKGVIKPLDEKAVPLVAWRLRNVAEKKSRILMEGLHTCANCHSFSADGKILGMDMDGPRNEKGLYAIVKIRPKMSIRNEDLIEWSTFRGKLGSRLRVGFMSQVSPDGRYVVTTINDPGIDQSDYERRKNPVDLMRNYYVANFDDFRFLQVFYPTRGILAWYSRSTGHLQYLPGADDTGYVHANACWSPDGKYLVFARAKACDAYPEGEQKARYANDPQETQIRYDLYRIPFNEGRGGVPEPVTGASDNGMSNSFPKISPDGKWIVFVKCRNGMLMRPDGKLYIVPAKGGIARRMNCNTQLMNSWHSFSPNSRWMVFTSKSLSPYTQMFLTHIDESGNDSPPILIENATAANRAVNIPEFVNIPPDGIEKIEAPAAEYALHFDLALEAMKNGRYEDAVEEWTKTLEFTPSEPLVHNSLGVALMETGKVDDAIIQYREAIRLNPKSAEAYNNLGEALASKGRDEEAATYFEKAVQLDSGRTVIHSNLGVLFARIGRIDKAIYHLQKVVENEPGVAENRRNLGHALAQKGRLQEAKVQLEEAVRLSENKDPFAMFILGKVYTDLGRASEAIEIERRALFIALQQNNSELSGAIMTHLDRINTSRK